MELIRKCQLALGIREDIPNLLRCSIDHPFMTFLGTGLDDIEEATAGIPAGELQLSSVWETMVDEFIDKVGDQLSAISALRTRFLVNAEVDTLGGHYPKNLFWPKGTHQKQIRLELYQLITCEFSKRRIEPLGQVYTSIERNDSQAKAEEKSPSDGDSDIEAEDSPDTSSISTSGDSQDGRHDSAAVLTAAMASPESASTSEREEVGGVSVEVLDLRAESAVMPHQSPAQALVSLTPSARLLKDTSRNGEDMDEAKADRIEPKPPLMAKFRYRSKQQGKRQAGSVVEGSAKRIKTAANDHSTSLCTDKIHEIMDEKSQSSELERSAASFRPDAESGPGMNNGSYPEDGALKDMPEITNRVLGQESGPSAPSKSRSRIVSTAPSECEGVLPLKLQSRTRIGR